MKLIKITSSLIIYETPLSAKVNCIKITSNEEGEFADLFLNYNVGHSTCLAHVWGKKNNKKKLRKNNVFPRNNKKYTDI